MSPNTSLGRDGPSAGAAVATGAPSPLDPALPALPLAFDLGFLSSRFGATSSLRGAPLSVAPTPLDVRYAPGTRCIVTYVLTPENGSAAETIGVVEIEPTELRTRVFQDDPALPGLAVAADGEKMRARFAAASELASVQPIGDCVVTPGRYKPEASCVLRYRLATTGGERVIFGKLLPGRAADLAGALRTLDAARRRSPSMPGVPQLIAFWPELHLVLQSAVDATPLGAILLDPKTPAQTRTRLVRRAGTALAALHVHAEPPATRGGVTDDIAELRSYRALFGHLAPKLSPGYDRELDALARLAPQLPEPAPVASHGALRADHCLVNGSDVVLIDLDGFCAANPARDVGNMLAYLDWLALRRPETARIAAEATRDFLEGYDTVAKLPPSWLQLYSAVSMLKIAGRRLRRLSFDEWIFLPELLARASRTLAGVAP